MPAISATTVITVTVKTARVQRAEPVAGDDPAAARSRQQQPAREARLEVARDREAGEDAAEGRGLQQHEAVTEGRVAGRVVEAGIGPTRDSPPANAVKKNSGNSSAAG